MRFFIIFLLIILAVFQYSFWFGQNGYNDFKSAQQRKDNLQKNVDDLKKTTDVLSFEVSDLKNDGDTIEETARYKYEMTKPDEHFYRLIK